MSSSVGRPTVEVIEHDLSMITDKLHGSMSNGVDFYGVPDLKQCEGLLKHTGVRKSDDDFAGCVRVKHLLAWPRAHRLSLQRTTDCTQHTF